jgi:hypothetical protein
MTEAYWRANQRAFLDRVCELEERIHGYSPLISHAWVEHYHGWFFTTDGMWQSRAAIPHVVIMAAALLSAAQLQWEIFS